MAFLKNIIDKLAKTLLFLSLAFMALNQLLHASEMDGWEVIYSGTYSDSTVCYDPDINRLDKEITCYGPTRKPDTFDSMLNIIGYMALAISAFTIFCFAQFKFQKINRDEFYNDEAVNIFVGFSFLTFGMLIAGFADDWLGNI